MRVMVIVKASKSSEAEDFGEAMTPDLREQEERLRAHLEQYQGK